MADCFTTKDLSPKKKKEEVKEYEFGKSSEKQKGGEKH